MGTRRVGKGVHGQQVLWKGTKIEGPTAVEMQTQKGTDLWTQWEGGGRRAETNAVA